MTALENTVTAAVLNVMRARRKGRSAPNGDPSVPPSKVAPAGLREARFSDFTAVAQLKRRWGLTPDSLQNWERLWRRNPALGQLQYERPIGWILEVDSRVVGYLGNISLLYRYGDRTLNAVTSHGLVVEPEYRAVSLSLVAAFYRQRSVDLYLTTTAVEAVGKMARAFKSDPLPQSDYDTVLFWVLQPRPFAQAMMKKLRLGTTLAHVGGMLGSAAVGTDKVLRRRWPRRGSTCLPVDEIAISQIGDDFQALWIEKCDERPRMLADRSAAALRWHFDIPGDRGSVRVLCCRKNGELLGYAVIRNDTGPNGLHRSVIADLVAKQDDPAVVRALLFEAYEHEKRSGSHILEVLGFPQTIRQVCLQWHPYQRKYPACPFYYKAVDPIFHKTLSDGLAWYATPFDGDTTLIKPSYSRVPGRQTEDAGDTTASRVPEAEGIEVR